MNNTLFVPLSDVCFFVSDKVETSYLTIENYVSTENMLPDKAGIVAASSLPTVKRVTSYKSGDVLTSNIRPYFKKIWFARSDGGASNDVLVLRSRDNIYPSFLYYLIADDNFFAYSTKSSKGTKMPRGDKEAIMQYQVPMYSLNIQKKIAGCLLKYDDLIENNNRRIAILEDMTQKLYREWFVHFCFPGHEPIKLVESELGMIPDGWKVKTVGSICEKIFSGGTPTTSNGAYWGGSCPWLSSGETRESYIVTTEKTITEEGIEKSSTRSAEKYDIVVASAGQGKTRGQTALLLLDTYINQSIIALKTKSNYHYYLYFNIKADMMNYALFQIQAALEAVLQFKYLILYLFWFPMNRLYGHSQIMSKELSIKLRI